MWAWLAETTATYSGVFRIIGLIAVAVIARILVGFSIKRIVNRVVLGVKKTHNVEETQELTASPVEALRAVQRTRTLGSVFNNTATWVIASVATILVLAELGFSVTALVASAGIIGAALGFGAQSIVKDVLNGLFMVFEDQLGVGDVVDVGIASGVVERVGIRITEIRDISGTLWFVRNGEILRVGNETQDWSRVIMDLPVPYESNIDEIQKVLLDSARAFSESPEWRRKVMEDPEVWGVQSLTAEAITLRLVVKVRPGEQWAAQRALYRVLKEALDTREVEIPALNRMVVDNSEGKRYGTRRLSEEARSKAAEESSGGGA